MKNSFFYLLIFCMILGCLPSSSPSARKLQLISKAVTQRDSVLNYRIEVTYPEVDSATEAWQKELNTHFRAQMEQDIDSFLRFIQDFEPDFLRELEGSFQLHQNTPSVLSISQRFVWAVPGTSVLLGEVSSSNYDKEKQRFIPLRDFFKDEDFEPELTRMVAAEVKRLYGKGICREVTAQDLQVFALETAGMRFFLDVYNGNHACQQIEIILPYEKLAPSDYLEKITKP